MPTLAEQSDELVFATGGHYRTLARAIGPLATARELVRIRVTPIEADGMVRDGRIDIDTHRWLRFAFEWCAPRLSSDRQDRAYTRIGRDGLARRIARCRRIFDLA
jgi:hypothetical protein